MRAFSFTSFVSRKKSLGQGMTEYIIIVALIAVSAIGVYGMFGSAVRNQVAGMAAEIGGQSGTVATGRANTAGKDALDISAANDRANLSNYDKAATKAIE
ncbi:pilus assembly protein [Allohahella marinimesophila]|uniref:Pilus assembly protein n=1 Tax=Allohahella marinimesophila TaxID=1054972 RepID=A0ABP7PNZ2_9GAMM